jgi:phage-related protein
VLLNQIDRLNLLTDAIPHLPFPHSSQIEGEFRELRCHVGAELYRVLYRRSERLIVLLHGFRKKTKKVPEAEIRVARDRWEDFKNRMEAEPRRPPRAAGHDAP